MDSTLLIDDTELRFYVEVRARWPTFAEYVKGSDLGGGRGGGGGLDLLELVQRGIKGIRDAKREHDARQIRLRIEEELRVLSGAK